MDTPEEEKKTKHFKASSAVGNKRNKNILCCNCHATPYCVHLKGSASQMEGREHVTSSEVSLKTMEFSNKGDCIGACPNNSLVCETVGSKSHSMALDVPEHCETKKGFGQTVAEDKKIVVADSGFEVDNISCISKADAANGTVGDCSGDIEQKNLTGSSGSVNSFIPIGLGKPLDVQFFKHFPTGSESIVECNNQFKGLLQYEREALQSPADFSDKSDPSETSSFRDELAGAFSPKVGLSSERGVDLIRDDPNNTHADVDPLKPEANIDRGRTIAAALDISDQNGHLDLKGPFNVKEPPLQCQVVVDNKGADELVDVHVCDICGDAGRERLLALCSKCSDGAEHTYCMRIKMDKLPEGDWICEECMEVDNAHKRLVEIEQGADAAQKALSSETGHGSGISSVIDSSKDTGRTKLDHAYFPSHLGKRPGSNLLANPTTKKRALDKEPSSSGFCVQPVTLKDSNLKNRRRGVRPPCLASSSGGVSSKEVLETARASAAGSRCMGRLIKSSSLEVHPHHDGFRERNVTEKSGTIKTGKEFVLTKLRRCESFRVSSPVHPVASDLKSNVGNGIKGPYNGIKCSITQRSHSFHLKSSHPVSPLSGYNASRAKTDRASPFSIEVKRPLVSRNDDHNADTNEVHRDSEQSSVNHTADKCARNNFRNSNVSGSKEKMLRSGLVKDRRSINSVKGSDGYCDLKPERKTDDMEMENSLKETNVQLDNKTNVRLNSSPFACTNLLAASSHPNLDCVWRGIFKVEEHEKLPLQCNGLQAHLSTLASPNVLELVSKWPYEIILKEVLKRDIWPDQFQKYGTAETNVALYFFAEDLKSYRRYEKFLDCMARNDLALHSNFDGVELLIFPSHCLPENSQRWNKLFYLWGVLKAKHSSCLDNNIYVASPPKRILNSGPESVPPGQQLSFPVLCGHENEGVSAADSVPVSTHGLGAIAVEEFQSADITKTNSVKETTSQNSDKCVLHELGMENVSHPAVEGSAPMDKIVLTGNREYQTKASFGCPQNEFSSPIDSLLYAVEVLENSKTSQGSFSVDSRLSDHGGWIQKQVDHQMEPSKKHSNYHSLNLEPSLWNKRKPEKNGELDLLLSLASRKDDQVEYHDNHDDSCGGGCGSGDGNVSLDLSLALPSV